MKSTCFWISGLCFFLSACSQKTSELIPKADEQPAHQDVSYQQDYSIKFKVKDNLTLVKVAADRNGGVQVLGSTGLFQPDQGELLFPGTLVPDLSYLPMKNMKIAGMDLYRNQFVYVNDKAVLSNAWAGKLYLKHSLPHAHTLAGGQDFDFLIAGGNALQYLHNNEIVWEGKSGNPVKDILFDDKRNIFWLLTDQTISVFSPAKKSMETVLEGNDFTCFALAKHQSVLVVGTADGYFTIDAETKKQPGELQSKLPYTDLTSVTEIMGQLWFGSTKGAFLLHNDSTISYYASQRWLPSDHVIDIAPGDQNHVLVLTDKGLAKICFKAMTLYDKAIFYENQVRKRHIRHGFNATLSSMEGGNINTGSLQDSDNDGLWTSMYLGAEVFRYAVTHSEEALENCRESMDAMERLYAINPVKGFPSRSFERSGNREVLADPERWQPAPDPEWDWKTTTSSDEAIGHMFVFGVMAELLEGTELKDRAIMMMDSLMQHIIDHDLYLVDWDGKPTTWGKWNPEYVNARPKMVGDRKINASNIISMLQTAYYFTKKDVYKEKAFELMQKNGYLENLMRPMKEIRSAPEDADDWSKMLSESWNHSDDEMYFLGYWGLYRYAFNDSLKTMYKAAIIDHWEAERPEKEGAWNLITAITGTQEFDLDEAIWYLKEYPMDLINWSVENSQRKDISPVEPNFRGQTIQEVLPPDELKISRHNANRFELDGGDRGTSEYSAGDIWLLPYWMGRYLGVITAPVP